MDRPGLAFLVAVLVFPLFVLARFFAAGMPDGHGVLPYLFASIVIPFFGVLFVGAPTYAYLLARGWTSFWIAPVAGAIVAVLTCYMFNLLLGLIIAPAHALLYLTQLGVLGDVLKLASPIGAIVGVLVWLIARPDRATVGRNSGNTDRPPKR
jgi:hypothetical protein